LLPEGGPHVMISPNMVVDGLTWREVTGPGNWYVVAVLVTLCPLPMLETAQTSTSYLVPGLSTGVVYCLCVAVLCTVLLQPPGDPLDGLLRYLS
jgi:hypothetical protein